MESLSYLYIALIFLAGLFLASKTAARIKNNIVYVIFIEHMVFSYLFFLYAKTHSADANMYYAKALMESSLLMAFGTDTQFIIFLTTFFVNFGFSKLATFFMFALLGFVGLQYLIRMLDYSRLSFFGYPLVFLVLLLPGFHFWTSALGKDSLVFLFLMMSFYALQKINKRWSLLVIAFLFLALIRPHIGFVILLSIFVALFLQNPLKYKLTHFVSGFVVLGLIILSLPFLSTFLNVEQLELDAVNERLEFYSEYGANKADQVSSYIDVSSYSLPLKMFAYLFRPLFFDAHSVLQLLASFENLFLFFIIYKWLVSIKFKVRKWYKYLHLPDKILFVYFILGWLVLAASMYNLGLASRQKYMLIPVLFILIFRNLQYSKNREFHK